MKKFTTLLLLLISLTLQAQKVKVKKGDIFLNKKKVGIIEKIKVKGSYNYYKVFDLEKNHLLNAKMVSEESKFFGKLKRIRYYIIESVKQKDSIGIENDWFTLSQKGVSKELVKKGILTGNGFNSSVLNKVLSETESKPKFARDKFENDKKFIENINYLVNRDKSNPLFVEKLKTSLGYSIINLKRINQTKYKIFQGKDKSNKRLIGYAYLEVPDMGGSKLIIVNSKESPIGYFDNFNYQTFYPLTKLEIKRSNMKRLDKPFEAIYHFTEILIKENKL